jgi:hypothetical protein
MAGEVDVHGGSGLRGSWFFGFWFFGDGWFVFRVPFSVTDHWLLIADYFMDE